MSALRLTVIGAGSVGLALAASLAQAGCEVSLMARPAAVSRLRAVPITIAGMLGEHRAEPGALRVEDADRPPPECIDCDVLVVTTKAYDVADAVRPYLGAPGRGRPRAVLLMQNGLGSAEAARGVLGPGIPVYSTAMLIGMNRSGDAHVDVTAHSSPVWIGSLLGDDDRAIEALVAAAGAGFLPMVLQPGIERTILSKLLFNTCMNPTGALTGKNYGALLENPHSRELIARLADETLRVFAATSGFRPAEDGQAYVDGMLVPVVIPRSAPHRSSMLQDLEAGRRTEIDFLNGAVVRMGEAAGVDTPTHRCIVALIHALERA